MLSRTLLPSYTDTPPTILLEEAWKEMTYNLLCNVIPDWHTDFMLYFELMHVLDHVQEGMNNEGTLHWLIGMLFYSIYLGILQCVYCLKAWEIGPDMMVHIWKTKVKAGGSLWDESSLVYIVNIRTARTTFGDSVSKEIQSLPKFQPGKWGSFDLCPHMVKLGRWDWWEVPFLVNSMCHCQPYLSSSFVHISGFGLWEGNLVWGLPVS